MKTRIIREGKNINHLYVAGTDVWLTDVEVAALYNALNKFNDMICGDEQQEANQYIH